MRSYLLYGTVVLATFSAVANACNSNGPKFDGDISKILKPGGSCPSGTSQHRGEHGTTCCCYDGCCWDNCRTQIPPEGKCLASFETATWTYDYKNKFWVLLKGPKKSLVPQKPASGCPSGTHAYGGTCCCEDGCCWDKCGSVDPNNHGDCLKGTGAIWVRNNAAGGWRAQVQ